MFSFHSKYFVYRELKRAPQKLSFCFKCPDTGTVRILGNILYLCFNLNENHNDDESDCINADDIMMMIKIHVLTAALMVMLKTVMNRIAKTLITLITISFIISIRLYSIVINEK